MRWRTRLLLPAALAVAACAGPTVAAQAAVQNGVDCNGFGAGATTSTPANYFCTDIRAGTDPEGTEDNGHYVGHDEPLVGYYSTVKGSGNTSRYLVHLPTEPPAAPTGSRNGPI